LERAKAFQPPSVPAMCHSAFRIPQSAIASQVNVGNPVPHYGERSEEVP
jgi:hypothetical protein